MKSNIGIDVSVSKLYDIVIATRFEDLWTLGKSMIRFAND
jgi:hypothetical protein